MGGLNAAARLGSPAVDAYPEYAAVADLDKTMQIACQGLGWFFGVNNKGTLYPLAAGKKKRTGLAAFRVSRRSPWALSKSRRAPRGARHLLGHTESLAH